MILTSEFFGTFPDLLIRVNILSKLTGIDLTEEHIGTEIPLLTEWSETSFSSDARDHTLVYNDYTFYCVGNREQVDSQIRAYFSLNRDSIIDDILEN